MLLVSAEAKAVGDDQRAAIREAIQIAQSAPGRVRPLDWQTCTTPGHWEFEDRRGGRVRKHYDWYQQTGAWPYDI